MLLKLSLPFLAVFQVKKGHFGLESEDAFNKNDNYSYQNGTAMLFRGGVPDKVELVTDGNFLQLVTPRITS